MNPDHWAAGCEVAIDGPTDTAVVAAVDPTGAPSRVELADGRVVDGDAIDDIVAWGGAE